MARAWRSAVARRVAGLLPESRDLPVRLLLSLGVVVGVGATGTHAFWTDSATVAGTTIATGSIDLKVDGSDTVTGFTGLSLTNLVPGGTTAAVLTVSNSGTVPLRFHLDAATTNPDGKGLGAALQTKVTGAAAVTGAAPAATCSGAALAGSGTSLSAGLIPGASPVQIAAGASTTVCIQVGLAADASALLQGATTGVSLTFVGSSF